MLRKSLLVLVLLFSAVTARADGDNTINARFDPLNLLIGSAKVFVDFKIDENWTLGPGLQYWHLAIGSNDADFSSDFKVDVFTVSARANWFKNGVYTDGLYVGPSIGYGTSHVMVSETNGQTAEASTQGVVLGCLVGYGWFWNSFNMMLGGGLNLGLGNSGRATVTDQNGDMHSAGASLTGLDLEYSLGWTF